jgi:hypothetical protein
MKHGILYYMYVCMMIWQIMNKKIQSFDVFTGLPQCVDMVTKYMFKHVIGHIVYQIFCFARFCILEPKIEISYIYNLILRRLQLGFFAAQLD